ncbi:hypothetical protein [Streptomyces benahoarensis]|uniref:Uncharacterized protein n=1 Tax=Streptomyces benahoarensis TaxID=2595054 RepID=A0A553ZQ75_9ACTN|nr:hypothetical protein [Streptomyces benahoarensis]TSB31703.1 hypothetical protein FNJ62_04935 [Streptomyces benahoarensis]TSB43628.1 hypothetical protein FNZ23_03270 [Streptomyces benahoarensis]
MEVDGVTVEERPASKGVAHVLGLAPGERYAFASAGSCHTADGRPVEVNEMTLDAASYVLEYTFDS